MPIKSKNGKYIASIQKFGNSFASKSFDNNEEAQLWIDQHTQFYSEKYPDKHFLKKPSLNKIKKLIQEAMDEGASSVTEALLSKGIKYTDYKKYTNEINLHETMGRNKSGRKPVFVENDVVLRKKIQDSPFSFEHEEELPSYQALEIPTPQSLSTISEPQPAKEEEKLVLIMGSASELAKIIKGMK